MMTYSHTSKALTIEKANSTYELASQSKLNWRSALIKLEGAYSENTIRSYRADFSAFETWCQSEGYVSLPALPETVAEFVKAQSGILAPATVSRRRAGIAKMHQLLKLPSPVKSEEVNLATRTMYRQMGRRQTQAMGLTRALKQKLIEASPKSLSGTRDRALISVGYDTLCRRSELVQLQIEDLKIRSDGNGSILVRRSKADQFGTGRLAYLSSETLSLLNSWLEASKVETGPIFRSIQHGRVTSNALPDSFVPKILKKLAIKAGLKDEVVANLSGHSMRVGAAQDMAAAGIDIGAIMHSGGWKSPEMVMRYIEHLEIDRSGMARLYTESNSHHFTG